MPIMHQHFSLKDHNSFRMDVNAALYAAPETNSELKDLLKQYNFRELPYLVLGEGSNVLFRDNYDGLILNPQIKGIKMLKKRRDSVVVKVGAAENWDRFVEHAVQEGWYGLENLSLIPGSVGAAPVQNIGAYGVELKDYFEYLEAWDLQENQQVRLNGADCRFGYRNSIFKSDARGRFLITQVALRLNRKPDLNLDYGPVGTSFAKEGGSSPADLRNVIISVRKEKLPDPSEYGNAGSFFKNPLVDMTIFKCIRVDFPEVPHFREPDNQVKIPAAWLIEQAGWKGKREGNVGTWPTQPLVIVNYGGATGQEILDFSEKIREDVDKKFGVYLEREVNVV